jgi:serine/threonine protein kinase
VCAAKNKDTGAKVAIKKITPMCSTSVDGKHTLREIRLMRHLGRHPNIISLKDLCVNAAEDELYVVMELMDTDLHRIIQSPQPLGDAHFKHFLYQLLRGLRFAHGYGVIHRCVWGVCGCAVGWRAVARRGGSETNGDGRAQGRSRTIAPSPPPPSPPSLLAFPLGRCSDLKPANLLVTKNCDLCISDFGLARQMPEKGPQLMTEVSSAGLGARKRGMLLRERSPASAHEAHATRHRASSCATQHVVTRWYRAPELMLSADGNYTVAIDMWSVGA